MSAARSRCRFSALQRAENSSNFNPSRRIRKRGDVSVLFSEPKIPQSASATFPTPRTFCFSALQRAENSSNGTSTTARPTRLTFQCSSASRKFLKPSRSTSRVPARSVSVLFSEPKIPQTYTHSSTPVHKLSFSALQRAENSSNIPSVTGIHITKRFSALQRAENSSKYYRSPLRRTTSRFQCSSASRKFLKRTTNTPRSAGGGFQCSSASRKFLKQPTTLMFQHTPVEVSVLFSEPKIPQLSEKPPIPIRTAKPFQCSSASRKFLNLRCAVWPSGTARRFSALQRAENSSIERERAAARLTVRFQCSSASRKFLNPGTVMPACGRWPFQCSSASRKFLNAAASDD